MFHFGLFQFRFDQQTSFYVRQLLGGQITCYYRKNIVFNMAFELELPRSLFSHRMSSVCSACFTDVPIPCAMSSVIRALQARLNSLNLESFSSRKLMWLPFSRRYLSIPTHNMYKVSVRGVRFTIVSAGFDCKFTQPFPLRKLQAQELRNLFIPCAPFSNR